MNEDGRAARVGCQRQEPKPQGRQEGNLADVLSSGCAGGLGWPGWGGPGGSGGREGEVMVTNTHFTDKGI